MAEPSYAVRGWVYLEFSFNEGTPRVPNSAAIWFGEAVEVSAPASPYPNFSPAMGPGTLVLARWRSPGFGAGTEWHIPGHGVQIIREKLV